MKNLNNATKLAYSIFALVAIYMLVLPLFTQGMFLDGQQYAAVAMNYAHGKGTFWHPYLTASWGYFGETAFIEQPPLGFALQAVFFRIFGDSYLTERFYNLLTFAISIGLLHYLWVLVKGKKEQQKSWLAMLFFISIGTTSWVFVNNLWEVQMAIFDLLAVILFLKAHQTKTFSKLLLYSALGGITVAVAFFVKGVPGLFPLAVPAGLILIKPKKSIITIQLLAIISCVAVILGMYLSSPEAQDAMNYYLNERLLKRIDASPTVSSHFHILIDLFGQLIPIFILTAIPFFTKKKIAISKSDKKYVWFFLFVALLATLPLMLTLIQRGFYLYPSYFYYVMVLALLASNSWQNIIENFSNKTLKVLKAVTAVALISGLILVVVFAGKPTRDIEVLHDVEIMKNTIKENTTVYYNTYHHGEKLDMLFYMHLVRFTEIEPATKFFEDAEYCIQNKGEIPRDGYNLVPTEMLKFDLYQKEKRATQP